MPKPSFVFIPVVCGAALCLSATSAFAHQQWVLPNFFVNDAKDDTVWLAFEHTLGDQRFKPSVGPGPSLLTVTGPTDEYSPPSFVYTGKTRTIAETELKKPGTYQITAEEPEAHWTKLIEGDKKRWIRRPRDLVVGKKIDVSKRYWAKAIAYVTFRKPTRMPLAPQGDPLELVPIDHPNRIEPGKPFRIRVLAKGAPLSGGKIKVYSEASEGHDAAMTIKSGADGRAQLKLPKAGRYLVSITHEVPAKSDPKADAYVYSVHLMVEANARNG